LSVFCMDAVVFFSSHLHCTLVKFHQWT
jgi:hypothetical protein